MSEMLRGLRRVGLATLLAMIATTPAASASTDEFWVRVVGANDQWIDVNVRIYETWTGRLVGNFRSNKTGDYNFGVDVNATDGPVLLDAGVQYTLYFGVPLSVNAYLQGSLCPQGSSNCDAFYQIAPGGLGTWKPGSAPFQKMWGFNQARHNAFPVSISIVSATWASGKTSYRLRATSSGGSPYTYAWSNVTTVISGPTQNPNDATRTVADGQTVNVSVSVNGGASVRNITLTSGPNLQPVPALETTWSGLKALYR